MRIRLLTCTVNVPPLSANVATRTCGTTGFLVEELPPAVGVNVVEDGVADDEQPDNARPATHERTTAATYRSRKTDSWERRFTTHLSFRDRQPYLVGQFVHGATRMMATRRIVLTATTRSHPATYCFFAAFLTFSRNF
jgi:hypothetical protein